MLFISTFYCKESVAFWLHIKGVYCLFFKLSWAYKIYLWALKKTNLSLPGYSSALVHAMHNRDAHSLSQRGMLFVAAGNNRVEEKRVRNSIRLTYCRANCAESAPTALFARSARQMHCSRPICTHSCVAPDKTRQCDAPAMCTRRKMQAEWQCWCQPADKVRLRKTAAHSHHHCSCFA